MGQWTDDVNDMPAPQTEPGLSKMLTLEQVQEILNVKSSLVYALVRSDGAFAKTAERIAAGQIPDDETNSED